MYIIKNSSFPQPKNVNYILISAESLQTMACLPIKQFRYTSLGLINYFETAGAYRNQLIAFHLILFRQFIRSQSAYKIN